MKFAALAGTGYVGNHVSPAENVFSKYKEWLKSESPIFSVHRIRITNSGYMIETAYCSVFCSFKFQSIAGQIEKYIDGIVENGCQVGLPLLMLTGFNEKGYVTYVFGYDAEEEHTAYAYHKFENNELVSTMFVSELVTGDDWITDKLKYPLREEEVELFNNKKPDPNTPVKTARGKLRSTKKG